MTPPLSPMLSEQPRPSNSRMELWSAQSALPDITSRPCGLDFDPVTVREEPDIPEPPPRSKELRAACQERGSDSWSPVTYKEVEKTLRHTREFPCGRKPRDKSEIYQELHR